MRLNFNFMPTHKIASKIYAVNWKIFISAHGIEAFNILKALKNISHRLLNSNWVNVKVELRIIMHALI